MDSELAKTVDEYLARLPADRRAAISKIREVINANLPKGYVEAMQYGMPAWIIPSARYPKTYNDQPLYIAGLASQKSHMALYLMGVYGHPTTEARFREAFAAAGKKLDMGKSCIRFRKLDDLALEVIAESFRRMSVDRFVSRYEAARAAHQPKSRAEIQAMMAERKAAKPATKKPARGKR